jgi:hypothetical protein
LESEVEHEITWDPEIKFEHEYVHKSGSQWFGRLLKKARARILHQHSRDFDYGIFAKFTNDIPEPCLNFVTDQLIRFGLPMSDALSALPVVASEAAFSHVGTCDPYVLFTRGLSDVDLTDEWQTHAYEVFRHTSMGTTLRYEPKVGDVESYRINVVQSERVYRDFMSAPFLGYAEAIRGKGIGHMESAPDGGHRFHWVQPPHPLHDIAFELQDTVFSTVASDMLASLGRKGYEELRLFCRKGHEAGIPFVDMRLAHFYFELAAWAAFVWLVGPLGRNWRIEFNVLTEAVHDHGEALLVGYTVFARDSYRKTLRPVESCHHCHIQSWCLSDKLEERALVKICEHCVTEGMPILPPANCGKRLCRMPACKHHPMFTFDPNLRLHQTMRTVGALAAQTSKNPALLEGRRPTDLLL